MTKNILMRRNYPGGVAPFSRDMDAFMHRVFGDQERDITPMVPLMPTLRGASIGMVPKVESYIDNNTLIVNRFPYLCIRENQATTSAIRLPFTVVH